MTDVSQVRWDPLGEGHYDDDEEGENWLFDDAHANGKEEEGEESFGGGAVPDAPNNCLPLDSLTTNEEWESATEVTLTNASSLSVVETQEKKRKRGDEEEELSGAALFFSTEGNKVFRIVKENCGSVHAEEEMRKFVNYTINACTHGNKAVSGCDNKKRFRERKGLKLRQETWSVMMIKLIKFFNDWILTNGTKESVIKFHLNNKVGDWEENVTMKCIKCIQEEGSAKREFTEDEIVLLSSEERMKIVVPSTMDNVREIINKYGALLLLSPSAYGINLKSDDKKKVVENVMRKVVGALGVEYTESIRDRSFNYQLAYALMQYCNMMKGPVVDMSELEDTVVMSFHNCNRIISSITPLAMASSFLCCNGAGTFRKKVLAYGGGYEDFQVVEMSDKVLEELKLICKDKDRRKKKEEEGNDKGEKKSKDGKRSHKNRKIRKVESAELSSDDSAFIIDSDDEF
jgi:hypothetical protein